MHQFKEVPADCCDCGCNNSQTPQQRLWVSSACWKTALSSKRAHKHRKQLAARWSYRENTAGVTGRVGWEGEEGVIAIIQHLQRTRSQKIKTSCYSRWPACHGNSLNHSNVLSRLFLSELLDLGAGSSASWQSLIQIWIMHDDEYNASTEWRIEIGTLSRCMWMSMGVCRRVCVCVL